MAPYRPKSLDELNQAYDKVKAEREAAKPAPAVPQPPKPAAPQPPKPVHSIADTVRARENNEALSGAVDDFIKQFSAQDAAKQSAYAKAQEQTQTAQTQARQELAQETKQAFDDVLSFPEIKTGPLEPPVYHRYTHEEAPIKEGDLSGLMDEYIAVMTDQKGEEENRRSFLRRRWDRKKNRQPQHAEPEVAAEPVDLPAPEPVSPPVEQPPVVSYVPPVAPVEIPVEEPVAPVEIPAKEPVAPVEIPFEEPVAPVEIPLEEPVAPVEIPVEEPVTPVEIPVEEPVAPVEIPFEEPVAPVEIPFEEPVAPVEIPFEEPVAPVEIPVEEPVAPVEIPVEEPVTPVEIPFEEPVAPVEIPVEEPVAPVEIPVEEPVAPAAPPEPVVPKMPEYTPYHSPVPQPDYSMPQPVRAEAKPKRKINMEPEPVFDPHRLFDDLDDEPAAEVPAAAVAPSPEAPAAPAFAPEPFVAEQEPEQPAEAPQQFEDVVSYSDESRDDRFTPPEEAIAPETPAELPPEETAEPPAADDDEYDLASLDLQQEVVIRPSKVKVFFKVVVGLLILLSLLATAAVGAIRLVMNVNTGKSAFGDYYFFAVSNEYSNVGIHSGDLILAKRKVPLETGETAVYIDPDTRSFSFGKNDASSPDPELYNALIYNLSGIAVREENVLGAVIKTVAKGGVVVRAVLANFNTYLCACLGAFLFLLLIRVIFLRKKRRYLTVDELAQSESGKQKKQKPEKAKKAKKQKEQIPAPAKPAPQPAAPSASEDDLFSDID